MKIIKGLLYVLLSLFALMCLFVVLCALNPEITQQLSKLLYERDNAEEVEAQTEDIKPSDIANKIPGYEQYIEPNEAEIVVPQKVAGRNGYEPVAADEQEVKDKEGQKLINELGYGETGDGLSFDAVMYPYYNMLDEKSQHLYRQIYANANALNQSFAPIEDVPASQLKNVLTAVFCDHPELFWVDTAYACKYTPQGKGVEIDLQWNSTADDLENNKQTFEQEAQKLISEAAKQGNNYEKEKYVHDQLLDQLSYNLRAPLNQSAYSALVNHETVCAGYTRAMQYIMMELQIPCYYCMGYAGESHAWNIINLDNEYYNVDTTWDDTDPNTYDYFNKSDTDLNKNHKRTDLSIYLPACNGEKYAGLEQNEESADTVKPEEPKTEQQQSEVQQIEQPVQQTEQSSGRSTETLDNQKRSLEDTGFSEQDVIDNQDDYFKNCEDQILGKGIGNYDFQNVIRSNDLYQQLYESYRNDTYKSAYVDSVMSKLGAQSFHLNMKIEELQNGEFLLTHQITIH